MAILAPVVQEGPAFADRLAALRGKYPAIDGEVGQLKETLVMDYGVPHVPVAEDLPGVYAIRWDYRPAGSNGRSVLLITYRATERKPTMNEPLCTYTLLTIVDLE